MKLNRILPSILAMAAALSGLTGTAAGAMPVSWYRFAPGCPVGISNFTPPFDTQVTELRCGRLGRYFFGSPGLSYEGGACPPFQSGTEVPPLYPVETTAGSGTVPCQNGSCLGSGSPWAAVIDWNAPHGWTVAATLREASDARVNVELFNLAAPGSGLPSWLTQVGDAHVLAQACAVAERAAVQFRNPPLAVNLSVGRLATKADKDCAQGAVHLSCEIEDVLVHLQFEYGATVVAAAGHHGEMLFPAAASGVTAAGSLNLETWRQRGEVLPLPETPKGAGALVPIYGLYLSLPGGGAWAVPPGSSYASAFLAGWMAGSRAGDVSLESSVWEEPPPPSSSELWEPYFDGWRYWLSRKGLILPDSALNGPKRLLERALGFHPEVCNLPAPTVSWDATVTLIAPANSLPVLMFPEVAANVHGPQPGSHPCIPCHGGRLPEQQVGARGGIFIELGASEGFPPQHQLEGIYLQVGGQTFEFDRSQDPQLLADFAAHRIRRLRIFGIDALPGEALALVYTLRLEDGTAFRDQTPIHLHAH